MTYRNAHSVYLLLFTCFLSGLMGAQIVRGNVGWAVGDALIVILLLIRLVQKVTNA